MTKESFSKLELETLYEVINSESLYQQTGGSSDLNSVFSICKLIKSGYTVTNDLNVITKFDTNEECYQFVFSDSGEYFTAENEEDEEYYLFEVVDNVIKNIFSHNLSENDLETIFDITIFDSCEEWKNFYSVINNGLIEHNYK